MKKLNLLKKGFLMFILVAALQLLFCVPAMAEYIPKVPTGLKQIDARTTEITLQVDEDVLADDYEYQYSTDNLRWSEPNRFYNYNYDAANNLQIGTSYYFRVRAVYPDKTRSDWCEPVLMTTRPHDLSSDMVRVQKKADALTVRWGASMTATGYRVKVYQNNYEIKNLEVNGTNPFVTITGLEPDELYEIKVWATRSTDSFTAISAWSRTESFHTMPKRINGLKLYMGGWGNTGYNFEWTKPKYDQDGYQIEYQDLRTKKKYYVSKNVSSSMTINLAKNRFYRVRIRSYEICDQSKKSYSPWSGSIYANVKDAPSLKNVRGGVRVSWGKVAGAHSYSVYAKAYGEDSYHKVCTTKKNVATVKKYEGMKLEKGTTYSFYVVANRKVGRKTFRSGVSYDKSIRYY